MHMCMHMCTCMCMCMCMEVHVHVHVHVHVREAVRHYAFFLLLYFFLASDYPLASVTLKSY